MTRLSQEDLKNLRELIELLWTMPYEQVCESGIRGVLGNFLEENFHIPKSLKTALPCGDRGVPVLDWVYYIERQGWAYRHTKPEHRGQRWIYCGVLPGYSQNRKLNEEWQVKVMGMSPRPNFEKKK